MVMVTGKKVQALPASLNVTQAAVHKGEMERKITHTKKNGLSKPSAVSSSH